MLRTLLPVLVAVLAWSDRLAAQCALDWSPGNALPQLVGQGRCSTQWDPDGSGPLPQRLVIGGSGLNAGSLQVDQRVLTWDGSQWDSLDGGLGTNLVAALAVWNGQLVVGGGVTGPSGGHVATWSGSAWLQLGGPLPRFVECLAVWNGNLVALGNDGGTSSVIVQTWNGTAWTQLPSPPMLQIGKAVVQFEGELIVAGSRMAIAQGILERWNGSSWATSVSATGSIECLTVRWVAIGAEVLYAGGNFTSIGGTSASKVASTIGGSTFPWSALGAGLSSNVRKLHMRSTGPLNVTLVASTPGGTPQAFQFSSASGAWTAMGNTFLASIEHFAGSYHGVSIGDGACVRYNGSAWVPVHGPGLDGPVYAATRSGEAMILGGSFASASGVALNRIARWDGATFQPLGTGMTGSSVDVMLTLDNGEVVAGGLFSTAGGVTANNLARWNGSAWSSFGTGFDQQVLAICKMPNGDLVAGGRFATAGGVPCARIARWNGTAWSPLGTGMNGDVYALALRSDGFLFAGGAFTTAGGNACARVARWNGAAWLQAGSGCNGDVHGLAVRPNDDVVAVGAFTTAGGVFMDRCARWNGLTWVSMGANSGDVSIPHAVFSLPNGDVVAGRGFHQPLLTFDSGISRWDGSTWSSCGNGPARLPGTGSPDIRALALRADGALVVGGNFISVDGVVSAYLATTHSSCMPAVQSYGTGCSSAAGPLVVTADTLPWIGPSFRTTTTGLAPGSLCFAVIGFTQTAIPLAALLPQGQPGCTQLTTFDIAMFLPAVAGTAQSHLALPLDVSLLGVNFFHQSVVLELNGSGALAAVRSSNGLSAIIGTL